MLTTLLSQLVRIKFVCVVYMNLSRQHSTLSTSKFSAIMASTQEENPDLSPTSPGEESDAILSPQQEVEPVPRLNGVPVRCT